MSFTCNEGSTFRLQSNFFGLVGTTRVPITPSAVRYRIKDVDNNRVVRDWTPVTAAASVLIDIEADENSIYDTNTRNRTRRQRMSIVVQANPGLTTQYGDEFLYEIRNLRGYES
jgi:hypothetical protein